MYYRFTEEIRQLRNTEDEHLMVIQRELFKQKYERYPSFVEAMTLEDEIVKTARFMLDYLWPNAYERVIF